MATSPYINSVQQGTITIANGASSGTLTLSTSVGALAYHRFPRPDRFRYQRDG